MGGKEGIKVEGKGRGVGVGGRVGKSHGTGHELLLEHRVIGIRI